MSDGDRPEPAALSHLGGLRAHRGHPRALRFYEELGLVVPSRTERGTRRYSQADLARVTRVRDLAREGLTGSALIRILALEAEVHRLLEEVERARAEGREEVEAVHRRYRRDLVPLPPEQRGPE